MPSPARRPKINILSLSPWPFGGPTSLTVHTYKCLKSAGWDVKVLRPNNNRDEGRTRLMALDVPYQNVSVERAVCECRDTPAIMTSVAREKDLRDPETIYKLIDVGCYVVVHGYKSHTQFQHLEYLGNSGRGLCVRQSMQGVYPGIDLFLPHPYLPKYFNRWWTGNGFARDSYPFLSSRKHAGSLAMVVKHKNPEIILEANRLLDHNKRIKFLGGEDRMYAKFRLSKQYPEYEFSQRFSNKTAPVDVAAGYKFMIDLTSYEVGNGGTQYTFFEAMDAGCVLTINRDWLKDVGDMKENVNCVPIAGHGELAGVLSYVVYRNILDSLAPGYAATLAAHGPQAFSKAVKELISC